MSSPLILSDIAFSAGGNEILSGISLDLHQGEFVTLLGPSGCGKSTLLGITAGFIEPTRGRVYLHGEDVTGKPPYRRRINLVFQRATLFPHLDVFENVAYGLRVEKLDDDECRRRVGEVLELVRLNGFERRRAHELSGGQMQRVALARALAKRPDVLLLDEPLSALDLKIRLEMETELRRVHRETGATFMYVTHDQREALALSDRVVLMNGGRVEQIATPNEIYSAPQTPFAARFVGGANVVPVEIEGGAGDGEVVIYVGGHAVRTREQVSHRGAAWLIIRQEAFRFGETGAGADGGLRGTVCDRAFRGTGNSYEIDVPGLEERIKAELPVEIPSRPLNSEVTLVWDPEMCTILPRGDR